MQQETSSPVDHWKPKASPKTRIFSKLVDRTNVFDIAKSRKQSANESNIHNSVDYFPTPKHHRSRHSFSSVGHPGNINALTRISSNEHTLVLEQTSSNPSTVSDYSAASSFKDGSRSDLGPREELRNDLLPRGESGQGRRSKSQKVFRERKYSKLNESCDALSPILPSIRTAEGGSPLLKEARPPINDAACSNFGFNFYWMHSKKDENSARKPAPVKDATMVTIGLTTLLFGGTTENGLSNSLWIYNTFKEKWKAKQTEGIAGRSGHSAVVLKGQMYLFGGEVAQPNNPTAFKQVSNAVYSYNPNLDTWNLINPSSNSLEVISARKHHASCAYKNLIFVYGGISQYNTSLYDVWIFDTDQKLWKDLKIKRGEKDPKGISGHSMISVFDEKLATADQMKKQEGFYVFGGKNENGEALNTLKVLSIDIDAQELKWSYPATKGQGPAARFHHTMQYQADGNYILIYGGKRENFSHGACFNDIKLLQFPELTWVTPIVSGAISKQRYGHTACLLDGQMLVFGGHSKSNYCDNNIETLELRSSEVRKQLNKQVVEFFVDATQKVEETHEMPKNEEIREPEKLPADEEIARESFSRNSKNRSLSRGSRKSQETPDLKPYVTKSPRGLHLRIDTSYNKSFEKSPQSNTTDSPQIYTFSPDIPKLNVISAEGKLMSSEQFISSKCELSSRLRKPSCVVALPNIKDASGTHGAGYSQLLLGSPNLRSSPPSDLSRDESVKTPFKTIFSNNQMFSFQNKQSPTTDKIKIRPYNQRPR